MRIAVLLLSACCLTGCIARHQVEVNPIAVKPIQMKIDVNVHDDGKKGAPPAAP